MKKDLFIKITAWSYFLIGLSTHPINIHVFGDSHALYCFSNYGHTHYHDKTPHGLNAEFFVHWLSSKTMHRIGRDGLNFLNIKNFGVENGDIVIYTFGEIDARVHIGKQRDLYNRSLENIITQLIDNYIKTIADNKKQYTNLTCIAMEIMPPTNTCFNPEFPFYGSLQDRIDITKKLNAYLKESCEKNNFFFLPLYDLFSNQDGSLNLSLSDQCVHISFDYNYLIKQRLFTLLDNL